MTHAQVVHFLDFLSGVAALVAAALWFRASTIKTPPILRVISFGGSDDGGVDGELRELFSGVKRQGFWNAWAAGFTGMAALTQSVAALISWTANS